MDVWEHINRLEHELAKQRSDLQLERAARLADVADLTVQVDDLRRQLRDLTASYVAHREGV